MSSLPSLTRPQPPATPVRVALMLALLLGLQPVTTDVYLPALPLLARALAAPMSQVQLTMSALILAFGLAQMVWGPVSDRIGRRPVLLFGLLLYILASIACALADGIQALVVWRVLQGAALAAAVVCARAIVRDLYEPVEGAQVMALALSGLGVIALAAPLLGGAAALAWGWRGPLMLVSAVGAATGVFVAWQLPETLRQREAQAAPLRSLVATWWRIGRHPVFLSWALLVACTYGGLFTVLASSSFIYMDLLGLSPLAYGGAMALASLCYLVGTLVCRRWIGRLGMVATVRRGGAFTVSAGLLIIAFTAAGQQTWWAVLLPQCLYVFAHGLHQPCGQVGVVGPFPRAAGTASALAGLLLALVAFGVGRWLGVALDGSTRPLAMGLGWWSLLTCGVAWTLVPRAAR